MILDFQIFTGPYPLRNETMFMTSVIESDLRFNFLKLRREVLNNRIHIYTIYVYILLGSERIQIKLSRFNIRTLLYIKLYELIKVLLLVICEYCHGPDS
jgi:hypothetical protein